MPKPQLTAAQRQALEKLIQADLALAEDLRETLETMPANIRKLFDAPPEDSYDET